MIKTAEILFIDDEPEILDVVETFLTRGGYRVTTLSDGRQVRAVMDRQDFDIVFSDLRMPEVDGIEILKTVKQRQPDTEVIIITGFGTIDTAVKALQLGAYDYLQKPIELERLRRLIDRILEKGRLQRENALIRQRLKERYRFDGIVGASLPILEIHAIIDRIRNASPTVLIQGESGTGKELVANVIHQHSDRCERPFIAVNCGAMVESLLESELFGHVRGAFTGAVRDNPGLFRAADGGTLFLDEVGEIPPQVQVKLLRALQERTVRAVGATREEKVDVRVIAATNRDTAAMIADGSLREDLYYRLNVVALRLPALRDIPGDIPLLARHFIDKFNHRSDQRIEGLAPDALKLLENYRWPGNVRQLENVIERAFALGTDAIIRPADLPPEIRESRVPAVDAAASLNLQQNEIALIRQALARTGGNKAEAARLLGVNTTTVYRKIEKYRLGDTLENGRKD